MLTEQTGLPLSVGISTADTHDSQGLEPLVRGIPQIRSRGILVRIARRGIESPSGSAVTAGWWNGRCRGRPAAAA